MLVFEVRLSVTTLCDVVGFTNCYGFCYCVTCVVGGLF